MAQSSFSEEFTFTIADAASLSSAVNLLGRAVKCVAVPSGVEGTHLRFYRVLAGTDYACRDDNDSSIITVPFTAGAVVELNPALLAGIKSCKLQTCSAADGTAQTQTGAASIVLGVI